jgi:hypothetical protein
MIADCTLHTLDCPREAVSCVKGLFRLSTRGYKSKSIYYLKLTRRIFCVKKINSMEVRVAG